MTVTPSAQRVERATAPEINDRIERLTEASVSHAATAGPKAVQGRLKELDQEWDIERVLQTNASALIFAGTLFGLLGSRKWRLLPLVISGFLFQHAIQGWCPPLPLLRRLGVRTSREIEEERFALKALRGDFRQVPEEVRDGQGVRQVIDAVRQ